MDKIYSFFLNKKKVLKVSIGFIILLSFFEVTVQSQIVYIEMSVTWGKNNIELPENYIPINNNHCYPYLSITYKNCTDSDIYCLKVVNNRDYLPFLSYGVLAGIFNSDSVFKYFPTFNFAGEKYFIEIYGIEKYNSIWNIISDTAVLYNSSNDFLIKRELSDFYNAIRDLLNTDFDTLNPYGLYFRRDDISIDAISNNTNKDFVFLKTGESYTEKFNLIGFYLIGGNYEFFIPRHNFVDYVNVGSIQRPSLPQKMNLPNQVNEYKLYSGDFICNSVSVRFQGQFKNKK